MNKKISFVKTIVPKEQYKEKEQIGSLFILHFDPVFDEQMNAYTCAECSVSADDYDAGEVQKAYEAWREDMASKALSYAIRGKIADIEEYDVSQNVNGFSLNGVVVWLDKATRVGLMNSTKIAKEAGLETTTLWLDSVKLEVDCDKAIQLLSALEMYALECFNVTAAHKLAVSKLETIEEVEAFDITADYPSQLTINV